MADDPENHRRAYAMRLRGLSIRAIASELKVDEDVAEQWIQSAIEELQTLKLPRTHPVPSSDEVSRASDASDLLTLSAADNSFIRFVPAKASAWDYEVWFDDIASNTFDDLVDQSVIVLQQLPGVTSTVREDRELLLVAGSSIELIAVQNTLLNWWIQRLSEIAAKN